ncbi:MAG: aminopeptidase P N-terminal domain-containing protein, partial [Gammaproteobacteria bacterium]|nr:aminopeptidase P N-terminal domain-containing protein [Gammaproteobacteria bacterium]
YLLFCRERDPEKETWNGRRAGQEGAQNIYHAEDSFPMSDIDDILPGLLEKCEKVYYTMGCDPGFDNRLLGWLKIIRQHSRSGARTPDEFVSLEHLLHDMRLFKSKHEVKQMQKAMDISIKAHKRVMRMCKPGMMEYEIEAELLYVFNKAGCDFAYPSIVGGGENGCILHYTDNADELRDGDLLLIDAGAEHNCYAADITRTFPVNGKYSGEQKAVYEVVLEAQLAAIAAVKPGNQWQDPHHAAVRVLAEGMSQLKIFKGSADYLIETEKYKQLYMHRTGHWLGMDVHDVGDYKVGDEWRELEAGMSLTVEPGMYITEGSPDVDERWWNIGIRIEDDVLVTEKGCKVLTHAMPKTIKDIESLMRE